MKTKEEVIREAYGKYYNNLSSFIWLADGYCQDKQYNQIDCPTPSRIGFEEEFISEYIRADNGERMVDVFRWIPKSIEGIEDNNGWTAIKSEEDLPKDNGLIDYYVFNFTNQYKYIRRAYKKSDVRILWEQEEITHYQPITKPKPPLY